MSLTLVVGGTRSGKSAHAERLAGTAGRPVRYLATADPADASMHERIARHRARRPPEWETAIAADDLAAALTADGVTLLDGLGVWVAGALHRGTDVGAAIDRLIEGARQADVIVVAEEAGHGLLPADAISRAWLDALGEATQRLSAVAARVDLVVAGRAISLGGAIGASAVAPSAVAPSAVAPSAVAPSAGAPSAVAPSPELRRHGDTDVRDGDADHAVNVLEPGPPAWLREALGAALDHDAARYPREADAVAALAGHHGRHPREIVPVNGAAEALWLLGPALRPRLAACVHPGFTEAEAGLHAHGVPVVRVFRDPEAGFRLDPGAVPEAADLVVVGHPASPSGTLDPAAAVLALRRPGRTLAVDEAFMSMIPGEPGSLAGEPLDDVIVIRSLTKLLSIPGLRAGYAIAAPRLAEALRAVRPPWAANALALTAMTAAASRPAALAALADRAAAERDDLVRRLAAIGGVRTWPPAANFCLVEVADGPRTIARLRERGIAVRPAASFPGLGAGHLRITARDPARNAALAEALTEALAEPAVETVA